MLKFRAFAGEVQRDTIGVFAKGPMGRAEGSRELFRLFSPAAWQKPGPRLVWLGAMPPKGRGRTSQKLPLEHALAQDPLKGPLAHHR